ncbi:MAG: sulfite exporter TauE/SafE family protein [Bacteroidia bacterium]|nr:sulfite exporter TauE/SafE family protein [Bacteroidia bacterium]HQV01008.1 sulfite exporter TauE/SafE family protein [Bacteroidia bacterium]
MQIEWLWILLCLTALLAGFTDAVVGGGGLIQLPVLFLVFPAWLPVNIIATGRLAGACGTFVAAFQYVKKVQVKWPWLLATMVAAMLMALVGAFAMKQTPPQTFKPLVFIVLVVMALYTFAKKQWGFAHHPSTVSKPVLWAGLIGMIIGFYNGYMGPGTGSLLVFAYISILKHDFLHASASAKVINFFTDLSTIIYFIFIDAIAYKIAIPMAICNVAGGYLGSHLAIAKGSAFVRVFFMILMIVLILRFGYEIFIVR